MIVQPPSTARVCPVTKLEASDAKKSSAPASSPGSPVRPIGARLRIQRWLNVETSTYDHAYFRVSSDGSTWTTMWENSGEITDTSWNEVEFDVSSVTDGNDHLYLRWTMGTTDSSWLYSGWNLDDVEVSGIRAATKRTLPVRSWQ